MKGILINRLFKQIGIRESSTTVEKIKLEGDINIFEFPVGEKRKAKYLVFSGENYSAEIKKFLLKYRDNKKLEEKTRECIDKNSSLITNKFILDNIKNLNINKIKIVSEEETEVLDTIKKYKYKSNSYEDRSEKLILDVILKKRSPYIKDEFDIPNGTRYTWFSYGNELRILYSFFEDILNIEYMKKYKYEEVIEGLKEIKNKVDTDKVIVSNVKESYLKNIEIFEEEYKRIYEEDKREAINFDKGYELIIADENIWNAFWESRENDIKNYVRLNRKIAYEILEKI